MKEFLSLFFTSINSPDTAPFVIVITCVAILAVVSDILITIHYNTIGDNITSKVVKFLERESTSPVLRIAGKYESWFIDHSEEGLGLQRDRDLLKIQRKGHRIQLARYPRFIQSPAPRSPFSFCTVLLPGIGVLGTFWGISLGLQAIGFDSLDSTELLLSSSTELLSGMRTAFSTSVFGLLGGMLLTISMPFCYSLRERHRQDLSSRLRKLAYVPSAISLLSQLGSNQDTKAMRDVADRLSDLGSLTAVDIGRAVGESIRVEIGEAIQVMSGDVRKIRAIQSDRRDDIAKLSQALQHDLAAPIKEKLDANTEVANRTAESVRAMHQALDTAKVTLHESFQSAKDFQERSLAQFESVSARVGDLHDLHQQQGQAVTNLVQQLRSELIEPVVERLDKSAELTSEASESVRQLKESLGGITEELGKSVVTIQEFQKNTLERLEDFASSLKDILSQFQNDTRGVMDRVSVEIQNAVRESIKGLEAQREAFEESGERAAALMSSASNRLSNTLEKIDRMLMSTEDMLERIRLASQDELEKFRENYQASLDEFFNQQNNLLEKTLGEQRDGLARVVADLQNTFKEEVERRKALSVEVDRSLGRIQESAETINSLVSAVGLHSGDRIIQLQELASTIGDEIRRVESSLDRTCDSLSVQLDNSLTKGNESLSKYLEQASEIYSNRLIDFDSSAAKICEGLHDVAGYLAATANELKESSKG